VKGPEATAWVWEPNAGADTALRGMGGAAAAITRRATRQGLTLVRFLAKLERFLWDTVCMQGLFNGVSRGCSEVIGGV
jgi:hypothetical protein